MPHDPIASLSDAQKVQLLERLENFARKMDPRITQVMASLAGSIIGVLLIATRRGSMQYALPFGTFLAVGALLAAVVGDPIVSWYAGLYR